MVLETNVGHFVALPGFQYLTVCLSLGIEVFRGGIEFFSPHDQKVG